MATPFRLRAPRPIVWISDVCERRKPSLSASRMATHEHSGMSRPSRRRLMPTSTSYVADAEVADDGDALQRLDVRVQVVDLDAQLHQVARQILGHPLGQRRDHHPLALRDALLDHADQIVDLPFDRPDDRSADRAGRWDGSPAPRTGRRSSPARTDRAWPRRRRSGSASLRTPSNASGRLSIALGRRNPYSTSVSLRARSPPHMARTCGMVWCDSSTTRSKSFGK